MGRRATPIILAPEDRAELERRVRARASRQQDARRAEIVLRAARGARNVAIAAALGCARRAVQHRRDRRAAARLAGLRGRPHGPPPRAYGPDVRARIALPACHKPADLGGGGQAHWSIADLTRYIRERPELGLGRPSKSPVGAPLRAAALRLDRR